MTPRFEALEDKYTSLWEGMEIKPSYLPRIDSIARRIIANKERYEDISEQCGGSIPWQFIGVIHYRESNLDFTAHLHNGDKPLSKKTYRVPRGRGPFNSFEESAVDALQMKRFHEIDDWSIARQTFELEKYNGFGYQNKSGGNPYLWGGSNNYSRGKYIRDHVYSATHVDQQLGVMPVLKRIDELDLDSKDIVSSSRKLSWGRRIRRLATGLIPAGGLAEWMGWLEQVKEFATEFWPFLFLAGAVSVILFLSWWENKSVEDYRSGHYTPSRLRNADAE